MALAPPRLLISPLPSLLYFSSPSLLRHGPLPLTLDIPAAAPTSASSFRSLHCLHTRFLIAPCLPSDHFYSVSPSSSRQGTSADGDLKCREPSSLPPRSTLRAHSNPEKKNYLLDVMDIRNHPRPPPSTADPTNTADPAELQVFEDWSSLNLQQERSSGAAASVIQEMRSPWMQWSSLSPSPQGSPENDPLTGGGVRPVLINLHSEVPERWDGPGGAVVLIDKPRGWSSFAVCGKLRHMLGVKKVGHAGTLDPLSTGLLIVCVGRATKLADSYQAMTKVYSGTMRIGETTPSLDAGTQVSEEVPWEHIQEQDLRSAVDKSFIGDIMQIPPMYSAIKVKGERLYAKARRGEEIVLPPRAVKVYDFQLQRSSSNRQEWDFYIVCSKGTYIRSLCADLTRSLGSCAYLTALRRERIGNLSVQDAWPIEELEKYYGETLKVPLQTYKSP